MIESITRKVCDLTIIVEMLDLVDVRSELPLNQNVAVTKPRGLFTGIVYVKLNTPVPFV